MKHKKYLGKKICRLRRNQNFVDKFKKELIRLYAVQHLHKVRIASGWLAPGSWQSTPGQRPLHAIKDSSARAKTISPKFLASVLTRMTLRCLRSSSHFAYRLFLVTALEIFLLKFKEPRYLHITLSYQILLSHPAIIIDYCLCSGMSHRRSTKSSLGFKTLNKIGKKLFISGMFIR